MSNETPRIGLAAGMIKSYRQLEGSIGLIDMASHITFGSFTLSEHEGNPEPTYWFNNETNSSINAVGLDNKGLLAFLIDDLQQIANVCEDSITKIRISLAPLAYGDLTKMVTVLNLLPERLKNAIFEIEINAACPNHKMVDQRHETLSHDPDALNNLMLEAKPLDMRKAIKISPNMERSHLNRLIQCCLVYGFSTIVSGNTLPRSAFINGEQRLSVERGGQGGAILFEPGVHQVKYLAPHCKANNIYLIGCGGILSHEHYRAYCEAGADEAQLATGFAEYGPNIFRDLHVELLEN